MYMKSGVIGDGLASRFPCCK